MPTSSLPGWLLNQLSAAPSPAPSEKANSVVSGDRDEPSLRELLGPSPPDSGSSSAAGRWTQDDAVAEDSNTQRQAALLEKQRDLILQQEALLVQVSICSERDSSIDVFSLSPVLPPKHRPTHNPSIFRPVRLVFVPGSPPWLLFLPGRAQQEQKLLEQAESEVRGAPATEPASVGGGHHRPHPATPVRKRHDEDEWESDDEHSPDDIEEISKRDPRPQGHRRSATVRFALGFGIQADDPAWDRPVLVPENARPGKCRAPATAP
jgi:hypothetical protein